jgi:topoisomerase IV subunit A
MSQEGQLQFGEELLDAAAPVETPESALQADGPLKRMVDDNFLRYASYVIRDRAIPEMDDGLKPVQRRILFSLHENDDGKFVKVANIVGYCMQFHPHGDASIGEALVTLANKQFAIERQGNFGNLLTGDPAAAPRYIECRLTELARETVFNDDLTEFVPSYDGRKQEPVTLPVKIPMLLMLGAEGIAVGLSTRILPHNFGELVEAQIAILHKKPFTVVPDFPQGGLMDASGYDRGRGSVQVRARIEKRDTETLVVRELPYGATTDMLIASIEDAARRGKVRVRSISDFTADRVEIEVKLQPEEDADKAIGSLYAFTLCQAQIASRPVVIRDNKPIETDAEEILRHSTKRLTDILRRELMLDRRQLNEELHRRTLVQIFVENRIYKRIESCTRQEEIAETVLEGLAPFREQLVRDITHADMDMLLGIPIRRIAQVDLEKNRQEMAEIREKLAEAQRNLDNLVPYAVRYLRNLQKKFAADHPRKTELATFGELKVRELTATELRIGYDREKGYLGHKIAGETLLECSSYDRLLLYWGDGRCKVIPPPDKLFVDRHLIRCTLPERDRVMVAVYRLDLFMYIKRFTLGGTIQNKEYRFAPKDAEVILLADDNPETIFARYADADGQAIRQQEFDLKKLPLRERSGSGTLLTSKRIAYVGGCKPADWNDALTGPRGTFMS